MMNAPLVLRSLKPFLFGTLAALMLAAGPAARAEVALPALFSDNMVLQAGNGAAIWGTADAEEAVAIEFQGQTTQAQVSDGRWRTELKNLQAGGPFTMTVRGANTLTINNILVGEVWLCSGQSNMVVPLAQSAGGEQAIAAARYPKMRFFKVEQAATDTPAIDVTGQWVECTPATARRFSAVAFYFGRELLETGNIGALGLIHAAVGATGAQSWVSRQTLDDPLFDFYLQNQAQALQSWPERQKAYADQQRQKKANGTTVANPQAAKRDQPPPDPATDARRPSGLYNGMIAPLIPYTLAGIIWYQGESNANEAEVYRELFPALIAQWRADWDATVPFLFVQLAGFGKVSNEGRAPLDTTWPWLREAQQLALALPRTAMAVAIDIGERENIHPADKKSVGQRLALAARAIAYGQRVIYSGPVYKSMEKSDGAFILNFDHSAGGLVARNGAPGAAGNEAGGFTIAGADERFVPARAEIAGDRVIVSNPGVLNPVAVRYAWEGFPESANLYNQAGLPAAPFRTDNFPLPESVRR